MPVPLGQSRWHQHACVCRLSSGPSRIHQGAQMTDRAEFDVLVVGAGPAGIAAACAASGCRKRTAVIDDNPAAGGQIWRGGANRRIERFVASGSKLFSGTSVIDCPEPGVLLAETGAGSVEIGYEKLIVATGARERFLPFCGWTLPNVT